MKRLFRRFVAALIKTGSLEIETASGTRFRVGDGDGSGQEPRLRFADKTALRRFVHPTLRFGELFMDERVVVEKARSMMCSPSSAATSTISNASGGCRRSRSGMAVFNTF